MSNRPRPERCARGHKNWIIVDQEKGWRRCLTCRRINAGSNPSTPTPAWGVDKNGKKQHSRGTGEDDTWGRTELLRLRGYDI